MRKPRIANFYRQWHGVPAVARAAILSPALALVAGAAPENLNIFDPVSPPASSIRDLFILVLAITGGIFVAVEGMLLYCIVRFRQTPETSRVEPPQMYGSKPIELAWTVAPLLIVFVLFMVVVRTVNDLSRSKVPENALRVTVVGHQWWWEYRYPDLGVLTANELHIPVGVPIYFALESVDVIHSFWLPRLGGKTDVVPGRTNTMWFQADEPGLYLGQCAEYCGTQHANMMLRVVAESPAEFQAWWQNEKKPAVENTQVSGDRDYFLQQSCVNCHTIRGTPARGTFGPDLTHLMSRQTLVTGVVANDAKNLTDWVFNPNLIKPGSKMPDMHLTEPEVKRVVGYLRTLK